MEYKNKIKRIIYNGTLLAFIIVAHFISPSSVYAEAIKNPVPANTATPTNTATQSTDPLKPNYVKPPATYSGVDKSIERFLCVPSSQTASTDTVQQTVDTGTSTERASSNADPENLATCINKLYKFGAAIGSFVAVFFIALAGYMYIIGGDKGKATAKKYILSVIAGLVIIFTAFILLRQINPALVEFRTIQPPQLVGVPTNYPACEDIGFEDNCVITNPDGSTQVVTVAGGYADCTDGLIAFDKSAVSVNGGNDTEKVCKSLMEKLKAINAKIKITVTATIDPTGTEHDSQCHKPNNSKSGVCADMVPQGGKWAELCQAIKSVGGLAILNESSGDAADCGKPTKSAKGTGFHLHVYLTNGGGGGGTSSGGSRPNCTPLYGFLCAPPAGYADPYPSYPNSAATTSSDSTIQANINAVLAAVKQLQKVKSITVKQLYRPHQYGAHLRSVFEAGALKRGQTEAQIKARGFYCDGSIQYVKKSDIDGAPKATLDYIDAQWSKVHTDMALSLSYDSTCLSDHGYGYAVDIVPGDSKSVEAAALKVGLCHNLPGDTNHYVLTSKNRNNKGCAWSTKP